MKIRHILFYISIFALFTGISCTSSKKTQADASAGEEQEMEPQTIVPDTFVLPAIPSSITHPNARAEYLSMHFWDRFDFKDRKLTERKEITEQALVDYINALNYTTTDKVPQSIAYTLGKAEADSVVYMHFASLFDKYLYDPNSPFRNEEFYIPVLEHIAKTPVLSEIDKSRYGFQLEMARKNRVGTKARDFSYTLASGHKNNLHSVPSEYLMLFFYNPDCSSCKAAIAYLKESQAISNALSMNTPGRTMLTVLAVYPDGNLDEWKANLNNFPDNWINAYDAGMNIEKKKLYDLRAIPTLYLLDKDKNVILKDASPEATEAFFMHPQ